MSVLVQLYTVNASMSTSIVLWMDSISRSKCISQYSIKRYTHTGTFKLVFEMKTYNVLSCRTCDSGQNVTKQTTHRNHWKAKNHKLNSACSTKKTKSTACLTRFTVPYSSSINKSWEKLNRGGKRRPKHSCRDGPESTRLTSNRTVFAVSHIYPHIHIAVAKNIYRSSAVAKSHSLMRSLALSFLSSSNVSSGTGEDHCIQIRNTCLKHTLNVFATKAS